MANGKLATAAHWANLVLVTVTVVAILVAIGIWKGTNDATRQLSRAYFDQKFLEVDRRLKLLEQAVFRINGEKE